MTRNLDHSRTECARQLRRSHADAGSRAELPRKPPQPSGLKPRLLAAALFLAGADIALADVHYVDLNSTNATPSYTNWVTAATNIQDAVDAAVAGDEVVVTNGTYDPINIPGLMTVRSVNGPQITTITWQSLTGRTNRPQRVRTRNSGVFHEEMVLYFSSTT